MRKIFQYIMLAVVTIVMASCTSDIEETTAKQEHTGSDESKDVRAAFHTVPSFHGNEQCGMRAIALSFGFGEKYHTILILL